MKEKKFNPDWYDEELYESKYIFFDEDGYGKNPQKEFEIELACGWDVATSDNRHALLIKKK